MENPFTERNYDDSIDDALIAGALKGESEALTELMGRHQNYIYNVSLKMLNNVTDAEDVTQEILIKFITQLAKFDRSKARFRTWIYRVTFNHVLNMQKNQYEKVVTGFDAFFDFIDQSPTIPISDAEAEELKYALEEAKVSCMAGMLMCLSREQRLTYIVGEIFEIDHNLAAEIFEITPAGFRKRLSRARKDLHEWIHDRCGLVNKENPCRCRNKAKGFIEAGVLDPQNLKWHSDYQSKIYELSNNKLDDAIDLRDGIYANLYRDSPFKTLMQPGEIYQQIMDNKDYVQLFDLADQSQPGG